MLAAGYVDGRKQNQPEVNLKKFPLHHAAKSGKKLQSWQQASPKQEQGYLCMGDARCPCGCHTICWVRYHFGSRDWKSLRCPLPLRFATSLREQEESLLALFWRVGEPVCQAGEPRLAEGRGDSHPAALLRCGIKPSPCEHSWEWDVISAKIPKTARQTSLQGFSPWGSLLKKALFFQRGRARLSLSVGALEIVSCWALEKRDSPGCESLWKPLSELFVAASLIFHATHY